MLFGRYIAKRDAERALRIHDELRTAEARLTAFGTTSGYIGPDEIMRVEETIVKAQEFMYLGPVKCSVSQLRIMLDDGI